MAIEIIPKIRIKIPFWSNILFGLCIILFVALLVSYFYFGNDITKKTAQLTLTPEEQALKNEIEEKEDRLSIYEDKINEFSELFSEHKKTANVLALLERTCLPNVWFSRFSFAAKEGAVNISGTADSFTTLGQQIAVFKNEKFINNVTLSGISMGEGGKAIFSFQLILNPQIFK